MYIIGPFDILLCVGKFFTSVNELESIREHHQNMPITTYILQPTFEIDIKLLPANMYILKSSGTQSIQGGITVGTCNDGEVYPAEDLLRMKDAHFKGKK